MTTLVYPTADRLRTRLKGDHGIPADRLVRSYVVETNGCWRWIKSIAGSGYGHFSLNRVYYQAHLLLYILQVGPLPDGLEPDHLCRNRWCVNPGPDHIEFVSHAVNVQRGVRTTLSADQATAILAAHRAGQGTRALGRAYGVNHSTISRLINGRTWPQLTADGQEVAA